MYGTIARLRLRVGQEKALIAEMAEWNKTRKPKVKGVLAGYLFKPDDKAGEMIMVAVFKDKKSYRANADDPQQDKWYQRFRKLLKADPKWEDGEFIEG